MIKKVSKKIIALIVVGIIIMWGVNIYTSLSYNSNFKTQKEYSLNQGWDFYEDNILVVTNGSFPYDIKNPKTVETVVAVREIPPQISDTNIFTTILFQQGLSVYLENRLIYKYGFEPKINQKSPGAPRVFVEIPPDSAGKTLTLKYDILVRLDDSDLQVVKLINSVRGLQTYVEKDSKVFFVTVSMAMLGVFLFLYALVFKSIGIPGISIAMVSLFTISSSLWIMSNNKTIQFIIPNPVLIHNIEYMTFYLLPVAILGYLYYNWKRKNPIAQGLFISAVVFYLLILTLKTFGVVDFYEGQKIYHVLGLIYMILFAYIAITDYKKSPYSLKVFYTGFFALGVLGAGEFAMYYYLQTETYAATFLILGISIMIMAMIFSVVLSSREALVEKIENNIYKTMAYTDMLTGAPNRHKYNEDMESLRDNLEGVVFIMMDIDNLKKVNDSLGHDAGDKMIRTINDELKEALKDYGKYYRISGDEFAGYTNYDMETIVEKLDNVNSKLLDYDYEFDMSISYGLVKYDYNKHTNLEELILEADEKMYENKNQKK